MPAAHETFRARNHRKESKPLIVAISVLQLGLIVLVWLLALVPVALMALIATVVGALKPAPAKAPTPVDS
jgi:hypothetical protein